MAETAQPVTMDKIVVPLPAPRLRLPVLRIYGGLGSTYDYGHYGVLTKNNIRSLWFRAMVQERDDIVAARLRDHPQPAGLGGIRPRRRLHRPARRLPHLQAAVPRRPARTGELRPQPSKRARRDTRLRPHRGAAVQPHVRDARRRAAGRGARGVPPPGDGAGHLHQLQERRPARAAEAAVRHRAGRQVVPQRDHARATSSSASASSSRWRWSSSSRPPRRDAMVRVLDRRSGSAGTSSLGLRESHLRVREHDADGALALLQRDERHRVPLPDRLAGARGNREPRRLRPHAAHAALGRRSSSGSAPTASATRRT